MAEGVNVRLSGLLRKFAEEKIGPNGLFANMSEYIRHLIRNDFEREEANRAAWLREQLQPGMNADDSEFTEIDREKILADAKARVNPRGRAK